MTEAKRASNSRDELLVLQEILKWTKRAIHFHLAPLLEEHLTTDKQKLVYELSDGLRTVRQIAKLAKVDKNTVSGWWRKWAGLGLVEPSPHRRGRFQRICSLADLGTQVAIPTPHEKE